MAEKRRKADQGTMSDETGKNSLARWLLIITVSYTFLLIAMDAVNRVAVVPEVWVLLGTLISMLIVWTAGPRIAQYLGPQVGAIASGIAAATRRERLRGVDDSRKDDESG